MATSRAIETELNKNKIDSEIVKAEIESSKKRFADEIRNISYRDIAIKSVKYKMPMKYRFRERMSDFFHRVKILLGL